jgi:Fe2+ or Zn2+ uptake regulation protein
MAHRPASLDELLDALRDQGAKITTARRAVLEEFLEVEDLHLSAEELTARIQVHYPEVHLSTVYRTLEFLDQAEVLTRVQVGHGPTCYHLHANVHHHAVCDSCGTTLDLPSSMLGALSNLLLREHGFVARPNHLTINGTCASCRAAAPTDP